MSNVHRLRLTDRIFFVNVNLRPRIRRFNESEYALLIDVLEASRRRLGFLLCGYVLMPDHWHAPILAVGVGLALPFSLGGNLQQGDGKPSPYFTPGEAAGDRCGNISMGIALGATRRNSMSVWSTCT